MKLQDVASSLRFEIIKMSNRAKAPHLASSLSCIDIVITLYEKVLNIFPKQPNKLSRDKFILSIAKKLEEIATKFSDVSVGSYPFSEAGVYGTNVVARHINKDILKAIQNELEQLR